MRSLFFSLVSPRICYYHNLFSSLIPNTSIRSATILLITHSMHNLLSVLLISFISSSVNGVGNDTTPTTSPSSTSNQGDQQLQLTDVSAICDPAIAAITAWLVLVIVSLINNMCTLMYTRQNRIICVTIICAHIMCSHIMCSHFLF